jgi:hypothetical protein
MSDEKNNYGVVFLRILAAGLGTTFFLILTVQLIKGEISYSVGEIDERTVSVKSPGGLATAYITWGSFFLGLMLAGYKPGLYVNYRWLMPLLLGLIFAGYIVLSVFYF